MKESLNYDSPTALRSFLEGRGLGMRKRLGQNFLIHPGFRTRLIAALELSPGDGVWEVGSGLGAMTRELLAAGALVKGFEIDPGFTAYLGEAFGDHPNFSLVPGDVLKTWKAEAPAPYLLGNLPYNIAAVLLGDLIEGNRLFTRLVVTVQREVGLRMLARPGQADYSSFSVLVGGLYTVKPLMTMGSGAFYPPPRIQSLGLRLDLREGLVPAGPPLLYPLVRRLFSSRRKTVKNSLCAFVASCGMVKGAAPKDLALAALEGCGIRPEERPENLDVSQFRDLARQLHGLGICRAGNGPPEAGG
ncbi:MAG: 16S rRNA (adenine(1518)-N(6)/adenine(1519)-N(6))-dimethyltransferase RsmA [Treponema sp.]|jgi:16S rRNA (adenine1518-N6/adenine1519-N6)-dimethyltransferase|nr:16S rRNA (adenine(1518)-N(6)/adenine(1519)-N(6))-dimethyltransferase RsmA [Treponema sp.]